MTHTIPDSQSTARLRFSPPQTALSVDLGGTSIRMAVVSRGGVIAARVAAQTPPQGEPTALRETIRQLVHSLKQMCPLPQDFVGVALPGIWDRASGVMKTAVNLPALQGVNVRTFFEEALERSPVIESDVNAAGWAQWRQLNPPPARFAYLSLGTGIGGSVILDGNLVRHTNGGAGHFGFLIVESDLLSHESAEALPTESTGAGEGTIVKQRVAGSLSDVASGPALQAASGLDRRTPSEARGTLSADVVERAAEGLAVAVLQIVHIYMPDVLVLGGGVVDHHPQIVERTQAAFERRRSILTPEHFRIEKAKLPTDEAGAVGAALLALARWVGN